MAAWQSNRFEAGLRWFQVLLRHKKHIGFSPNSFCYSVLTSSLGMGDRGFSGFVAGGECHLGCVIGGA